MVWPNFVGSAIALAPSKMKYSLVSRSLPFALNVFLIGRGI